AVIEHAVNEGLDGFYRQAVEDQELRVIGRPSAEIVELPELKDYSGDLVVDVEVDVRPEFDLPAYDSITVTVDAVEADEAAVDAELDRL
ncbi:trigger factor, partial [Salmonella sp. M9-2]